MSFSLSLAASSITNLENLSLFYIASPADQQRIEDPAFVPIRVNAFHNTGSFTKMEFFTNGVKLGEDTAAPFSQLWFNPPFGQAPPDRAPPRTLARSRRLLPSPWSLCRPRL